MAEGSGVSSHRRSQRARKTVDYSYDEIKAAVRSCRRFPSHSEQQQGWRLLGNMRYCLRRAPCALPAAGCADSARSHRHLASDVTSRRHRLCACTQMRGSRGDEPIPRWALEPEWRPSPAEEVAAGLRRGRSHRDATLASGCASSATQSQLAHALHRHAVRIMLQHIQLFVLRSHSASGQMHGNAQ